MHSTPTTHTLTQLQFHAQLSTQKRYRVYYERIIAWCHGLTASLRWSMLMSDPLPETIVPFSHSCELEGVTRYLVMMNPKMILPSSTPNTSKPIPARQRLGTFNSASFIVRAITRSGVSSRCLRTQRSSKQRHSSHYLYRLSE